VIEALAAGLDAMRARTETMCLDLQKGVLLSRD